MKRALLVLCCLLQGLFAEDIVLRTQLTPGEVWVGQRMELQIDVLGRDGWAQIAAMDAIEVPGSYVQASGNSRVRLNETIEGASYTGQRYELSIYPQRPGPQELPAIELTVTLKTWGTNSPAETISARTESISFTTKVPKDYDPGIPLIVSPEFSATQSWEPDQSEFTVGEALKRRILLTAADLPAMVLPPLLREEVEGISGYLERPELDEAEGTATRSESVTFVFERNVRTSLPTHKIQWWNPASEQLEVITLNGRDLTVTGGPAAVAVPVERGERSFGFNPALAFLFFLGLALLGLHIFRKGGSSQRSPNHEFAAFKLLIKACNPGRRSDALNALLNWLDVIGQRPSCFFRDHADDATETAALRLLSDPNDEINMERFADGLRVARKHYLNRKPQTYRWADRSLPPLNL